MARRARTRKALETAEHRASIEFERKLELIWDLDQAWGFSASGPRSGLQGGVLYRRLAYFLRHDFEIPGGAGPGELRLYSRLLRRLEGEGPSQSGGSGRRSSQISSPPRSRNRSRRHGA